jgi:hypothetical protein
MKDEIQGSFAALQDDGLSCGISDDGLSCGISDDGLFLQGFCLVCAAGVEQLVDCAYEMLRGCLRPDISSQDLFVGDV